MAETANIYQYDDFRAYLAQRYLEKYRAVPGYSYRKFAAEAGFSNPGFFNDVVKGRRTLSESAAAKMIAAFGLSPSEADYFTLLIAMDREKDPARKQVFYRKLTSRRNRSMFARLNPALSRYYQDFHYPLIRTALMSFDFRGNYEELAAFLVPSPQVSACKKYIRDLCDWGLVSQNSDGRYVVTDRFVEPLPTLSDDVRRINGVWIDHARDALLKLPPEKRHVSSMLLSLSAHNAKAIAEKVEKFREEIWEMVKSDTAEPECVMQLNLQYFPRSKCKGRS
jgi:uncharacterized protein (TIGR02147 family)